MDRNKQRNQSELIYLSIIIPALNEEDRIGKTLEKIMLYLDSCRYPYEIIVVNDGSTDRTSGIVEEFSERYNQVQIIKSKTNHGKGLSVRKGMLSSKGQY